MSGSSLESQGAACAKAQRPSKRGQWRNWKKTIVTQKARGMVWGEAEKVGKGLWPDHTGPVAHVHILLFPQNAGVILGFKQEDDVLKSVISREHYVENSAVQWSFLPCWKWSISALSGRAATSHVWLLSTWQCGWCC